MADITDWLRLGTPDTCFGLMNLISKYRIAKCYLYDTTRLHPSSLKLDLLWMKVEHGHVCKGLLFLLYTVANKRL